MFNFKLMAKAFGEVTPTQFQMLYLIVNNCALNKSNTIEMYNGFMMDKMGLSVRMVQYNIKALEEKGYISVKRPTGRNAAKSPNIITINDVADNNTCKESTQLNVAINGAIDCTPYKDQIKNKNILDNNKTSIILEPVEENENKKILDNKNNTSQRPVGENDKNNDITNEEMTYSQEEIDFFNEFYSKEWNEVQEVRIEESRQRKNKNSSNGEVTTPRRKEGQSSNNSSEELERLANEFDYLATVFYQSQEPSLFSDHEAQCKRQIFKMTELYKSGRITERQYEKFVTSREERLKKIVQGKDKFKGIVSEKPKTKEAQNKLQMGQYEENRTDAPISNEEYEKVFSSQDEIEELKKAAHAPAEMKNQNKVVLSPFGNSNKELSTEEEKTQQDANKVAKMVLVEKECNRENRKFNLNVVNNISDILNECVDSPQEREKYIIQYFKEVKHSIPEYMDAMKKLALKKIGIKAA